MKEYEIVGLLAADGVSLTDHAIRNRAATFTFSRDEDDFDINGTTRNYDMIVDITREWDRLMWNQRRGHTR